MWASSPSNHRSTSSFKSSILTTTASAATTRSSSFCSSSSSSSYASSSSFSSSNQSPSEAQMTKDALKISQAAINAVDPQTAIDKHLSYDPPTQCVQINTHSYCLSKETYDDIFICAFGRAATSMAIQTARIVSQTNLPIKGIVITKYDHASQEQIAELKSHNIDLHFALHPIPDDASIHSSTK